MSAIPYWYDAPEAWDQVVIAGEPLPGKSSCKAKVSRKIDVRNVRGRDGARTRDGGYTPAKVTIEVEVWEPEQLAALLPRLEQLHPRRSGTARVPVDVAHPTLAAVGISSVYVEEIDAPTVKDGILTATISCLEWTPEPPRTRRTNKTETSKNEGGSAYEDYERQQQLRNAPPATPPAATVAATRRR